MHGFSECDALNSNTAMAIMQKPHLQYTMWVRSISGPLGGFSQNSAARRSFAHGGLSFPATTSFAKLETLRCTINMSRRTGGTSGVPVNCAHLTWSSFTSRRTQKIAYHGSSWAHCDQRPGRADHSYIVDKLTALLQPKTWKFSGGGRWGRFFPLDEGLQYTHHLPRVGYLEKCDAFSFGIMPFDRLLHICKCRRKRRPCHFATCHRSSQAGCQPKLRHPKWCEDLSRRLSSGRSADLPRRPSCLRWFIQI